MRTLVTSILSTIICLTFCLSVASADSLLRGYGIDALTVDGADDRQELIDLITNDNVNSFRVQYFNRDVNSDYENDEDKGQAAYLDWVENTVLPHFATLKSTVFDPYDVKVMFSLHNPVGGRDEDVSPPVDRLFDDAELQETQIDAWRMVAAEYNSDSNVIYQIFSEPGTTAAKWNAFFPTLASEIRGVSASSTEQPTIIIMPPYGNPALASKVSFDGLATGGAYALSVNMYAPREISHYGIDAGMTCNDDVEFPSTVEPRSCGKAKKKLKRARRRGAGDAKITKLSNKLRRCKKRRKREVRAQRKFSSDGLQAELQKAISKAEVEGVALYIAEYAVVAWAPDAAAYLEALHEVFDENSIHSFYHILFESAFWDPRNVCDCTLQTCSRVSSTDRYEALTNYFEDNEFPS